ncbi:hypothetical protein M422DRAFT_250236 [Sphaerobolus stellatus SS14]|uniref:Methanethiol oxidase n=1 Tax=Sphaerobolus stellatus (strain SS14) TaxID=990650 RepID=A0A0C9VU61_SPHS4|nr:hypothetical protein M422DRAFT_250236 [Sphaerobolus stellatus SS14]
MARQPESQIAGAAYFMTNEPTGNFIVSSAIGRDGKVAVKAAISAGGVGLRIIKTLTPTDPLFSQGSVTVAGNSLYVVNPGSNTVAAFDIDRNDPTKLQPVGNPVNSGGEFPISVAVSQKRGLICVLNAGKINGVNCYKRNGPRGLIPAPNTQRLFHLNQTTPPVIQPGPNGFSHVIFDESETQLIVSVRNVDGTSLGFLAVWDINVNTGALSPNFRQIAINGAPTPFGLAVLPGKNAIIATDPLGSGYDIFDLNAGPKNRSGIFSVPGQAALCWSVYNPKSGNVFLVDSILSVITEVTVDKKLRSSIVKQYSLAMGSDAALDASIATVNGNEFLYVLVGGTQAINVLSVPSPGNASVIQELLFADAVAKLGVTQDLEYLQGMAIFLTDA